jgi:hypothetical protein
MNFTDDNKAAQTHGVFSLQDNGPQTPEQLTRKAELTETLATHEGIRDTLLAGAVTVTMLRELAVGWCVQQIAAGTPPDKIPMMDRVVAFINSERLALLALDKVTPGSKGRTLDAILRGEGDHDGL